MVTVELNHLASHKITMQGLYNHSCIVQTIGSFKYSSLKDTLYIFGTVQ